MRNQFVLSLLLGLSFSSQTKAEEGGKLPPAKPPVSGEFDQFRKEIDLRCKAEHPGEPEAVNECFIDSVHHLFEDGVIDEELFKPLLREGEMRMAFFRGFSEGLKRGRRECPAPVGGGEEKPSNQKPEKPGNGVKKVKVCHIPDGNIDKAHTIEVPEEVAKKLVEKGDKLGECEDSVEGEKGKPEKRAKPEGKNKNGSKKKGKKGKK